MFPTRDLFPVPRSLEGGFPLNRSAQAEYYFRFLIADTGYLIVVSLPATRH